MKELQVTEAPFGMSAEQIAGVHSIKDASTELPIQEEDVVEVLFQYESPADWDGNCCAVVRLQDGRLLAWESWWGPTGSGFHEDAYGGDAEIYFANPEDLSSLVKMALSEDMRRLAKIPEELWKE